MQRTIFTADHESFRSMLREFIAREVVPFYSEWEVHGIVPRKLYRRLGDIGVMGLSVPVEFGGGGTNDYVYNVVVQEEAARACIALGTLRTHLDIVLPYFLTFADDQQRRRWFPGLASGELFSAIAMTEPSGGSDVAGITTRAVRDGDHYVINGAKTFITGGELADLVIVLARTGDGADRRAGMSLIVVEAGTPGFRKGNRLSKIGLAVQDTVELSFSDVHVPASNRLGVEGEAFGYLMHNLAQERLAIAVGAVAQTAAALNLTVDYVRGRQAFGHAIGEFQNTRFELAVVATQLEAARAMLDRAVTELCNGTLSGVDAAKVKLFCTETQNDAIDRCLQLFGGYGYMTDYPIARLFADARASRIYGGTSEIMKTIISKSFELRT